MRTLLLAPALAAISWCLWRRPAWASGGGHRAVAFQATANFAERCASYSGIYGSLVADLVLGFTAFVVFGVCAGTETAITTLWPWKVRELAMREADKYKERENRRPGMWSALRADIQRFMQTILIGATISGVMSTAITTEICGQLFGPNGLAIATISVTILQLILCEIIPKSVAVSNAYSFARTTLPLFYLFSVVVYPLSRRLNRVVEFTLRVCGISVDASKTPYVSEEELDLILSSAVKNGVFETEEGKMITSVRALDGMRAKERMVPLVDMVCIEAKDSFSKLHALFMTSQCSRIPVYSERFDNITGVVSQKSFLKHVRNLTSVEEWDTLTCEQIADKPYFVPETMTLLSVLQVLKERTLAICVDEYGGTTGLVTLESVLEEIVGDIYDPDELDTSTRRSRSKTNITNVGDGLYSISAAADLDDVNDELGLEIPEGDYNSIGGFLFDVLDRMPVVGDAAVLRTSSSNVRLEVIDTDERKILSVSAQITKAETPEGSGDDDDDLSTLMRVLDVTVVPMVVTVEEGEMVTATSISASLSPALPAPKDDANAAASDAEVVS